jgi:hypothetical protein
MSKNFEDSVRELIASTRKDWPLSDDMDYTYANIATNVNAIMDELEALLSPAQPAHGPGSAEEVERLAAQVEMLLAENRGTRQIVIDLLNSADSTWEDNAMGHDWAGAVEAARTFLYGPPLIVREAQPVADAPTLKILQDEVANSHRDGQGGLVNGDRFLALVRAGASQPPADGLRELLKSWTAEKDRLTAIWLRDANAQDYAAAERLACCIGELERALAARVPVAHREGHTGDALLKRVDKLMSEFDSFVDFYTRREVNSPSNSQDAACEADERGIRWDQVRKAVAAHVASLDAPTAMAMGVPWGHCSTNLLSHKMPHHETQDCLKWHPVAAAPPAGEGSQK